MIYNKKYDHKLGKDGTVTCDDINDFSALMDEFLTLPDDTSAKIYADVLQSSFITYNAISVSNGKLQLESKFPDSTKKTFRFINSDAIPNGTEVVVDGVSIMTTDADIPSASIVHIDGDGIMMKTLQDIIKYSKDTIDNTVNEIINFITSRNAEDVMSPNEKSYIDSLTKSMEFVGQNYDYLINMDGISEEKKNNLNSVSEKLTSIESEDLGSNLSKIESSKKIGLDVYSGLQSKVADIKAYSQEYINMDFPTKVDKTKNTIDSVMTLLDSIESDNTKYLQKGTNDENFFSGFNSELADAFNSVSSNTNTLSSFRDIFAYVANFNALNASDVKTVTDEHTYQGTHTDVGNLINQVSGENLVLSDKMNLMDDEVSYIKNYVDNIDTDKLDTLSDQSVALYNKYSKAMQSLLDSNIVLNNTDDFSVVGGKMTYNGVDVIGALSDMFYRFIINNNFNETVSAFIEGEAFDKTSIVTADTSSYSLDAPISDEDMSEINSDVEKVVDLKYQINHPEETLGFQPVTVGDISDYTSNTIFQRRGGFPLNNHSQPLAYVYYSYARLNGMNLCLDRKNEKLLIDRNGLTSLDFPGVVSIFNLDGQCLCFTGTSVKRLEITNESIRLAYHPIGDLFDTGDSQDSFTICPGFHALMYIWHDNTVSSDGSSSSSVAHYYKIALKSDFTEYEKIEINPGTASPYALVSTLYPERNIYMLDKDKYLCSENGRSNFTVKFLSPEFFYMDGKRYPLPYAFDEYLANGKDAMDALWGEPNCPAPMYDQPYSGYRI